VRRTARELGVEISEVQGTGPNGRISVDDVKAHVKRLVTSGAGRGSAAAAVALPDFTRWGSVERQPMRAVRRKTAEHLSAAWATIPHVTQCDLADITGLEELRKKYAKRVSWWEPDGHVNRGQGDRAALRKFRSSTRPSTWRPTRSC
jgi:pyruvate dehydrogenase E2 component (dihydrolipoamide acetyltransferase)